MALEVLNTPAPQFQSPPPPRRDDINDQGGHSRRKRSKRSPRGYNESDELNLAGSLILLARTGGGPHPSTASPAAVINAATIPTVNPGDQDQNKENPSEGKIDKQFVCNICGRVFYMYQALGGHKTTHRQKPATTSASSGSDHHKQGGKVHKCSNCPMTFSSGQALGGHKRKHYEGNKSGNTTSSSGEGSSGVAVSGPGAPIHIHGEDQKISGLHVVDSNVLPATELDLTLRL